MATPTGVQLPDATLPHNNLIEARLTPIVVPGKREVSDWLGDSVAACVTDVEMATPRSVLSLVAVRDSFGAYASAEQPVTLSGAEMLWTVGSL